jgi:hypothetical protein
MKHHEEFLVVLALLLPVSNALAQTANVQPANNVPRQVAVARCAYTATDDACANPSDPGGSGNAVLAQLPRRGPGPGFGRRPMGGPGYPAMWQAQPSGRHALIGAVIGAALGWAVAAKGNAGARATLAVATVGAGLGAGMGLSVPSFPSRSPYFRRWPDDEDGQASARKSAKPGRSSPSSAPQAVSADPAPPNPRPSAEGASFTTPAAP